MAAWCPNCGRTMKTFNSSWLHMSGALEVGLGLFHRIKQQPKSFKTTQTYLENKNGGKNSKENHIQSNILKDSKEIYTHRRKSKTVQSQEENQEGTRL